MTLAVSRVFLAVCLMVPFMNRYVGRVHFEILYLALFLWLVFFGKDVSEVIAGGVVLLLVGSVLLVFGGRLYPDVFLGGFYVVALGVLANAVLWVRGIFNA